MTEEAGKDVAEALRGERGFKEIVRQQETLEKIGDHVAALAGAAVTARDPSQAPLTDVRSLIPAWDSILRLAESSIKGLKAIGVKEAPPTFEEISKAKTVPLCELSHLLTQEVEYTIHPICPRGALTMVQGMPKGGKSTFSLWLALCAAFGNFPSGIFKIEKQLRVLFIEFEDRPILVVKRAAKYLAGAGWGGDILPTDLFLCDSPTLWLDSAKYEEALIAEIKEKKYDVVVLDTLSYVHQAESENDAADMKVLTASLKRIVQATNCSLIFLHHTGKGAKDKAVSEAARGSSVIPACADVILHWGDRGETDITPVSVTSKYDDGFKCSIEYVRKEGGAVEWRVTQAEAEHRSTDDTEKVVLKTLAQMQAQSPAGVRSKDLLAALSTEDVSKRTAIRYINKLSDQGRMAKVVGPQGTVTYTLNGYGPQAMRREEPPEEPF